MVNVHCTIGNKRFKVNAEVLNLGGRQLILGLSWLRENGFVVNPMQQSLDSVNDRNPSYSIKCSKLRLPRITPIDPINQCLAIDEGDLVMVLDAATEYLRY